MTRFTNSPYERLMQRLPCQKPPSYPAQPVPEGHPCYGCGNIGMVCVGICSRWVEKKLKKEEHPCTNL